MISDFIQRLLFVKQFEIGDGSIEIVNTKEALVPLEFLVQIQTDYPEQFYKYLKKSVETFFKDVAKSFGPETFNKASELFGIFGLGRLKIVDFDMEKKKALVEVLDTPLVKHYVTKNPVCSILPGVLAGMFTVLLKKNVDARLNKCMAKGHHACEFIIK